MATIEEQVKELQSQLGLLTAQSKAISSQQELLTAQLTLQALQLGRQEVVDKALADRQKDVALAEHARDKAQAALPFAPLQGIKEGLTGLAVPGREGTLTIAKGGEGTLLLRSKTGMLEAIDSVARVIADLLPVDQDRFVIASSGDLEAGLRSRLVQEQIHKQTAILREAVAAHSAGAAPPVAPLAIAPVLAAVQGTAMALNVLSDAAKFFRTDRTLSLFDAGDEARRVLELLIEAHAPAQVERIDDINAELLTQAQVLLDAWLALKALAVAADAATEGQSTGSVLKGALASAKALLDAVDPVARADAFWAQAVGLCKAQRAEGRGRIQLLAVAQAVQAIEKRVWRSERLVGFGGVQVEYRITDAAGALLAAGIRMATSTTRSEASARGAQRLELPSRAAP